MTDFDKYSRDQLVRYCAGAETALLQLDHYKSEVLRLSTLPAADEAAQAELAALKEQLDAAHKATGGMADKLGQSKKLLREVEAERDDLLASRTKDQAAIEALQAELTSLRTGAAGSAGEAQTPAPAPAPAQAQGNGQRGANRQR